jgi:hypothetical protein
MYDLGSIQSRVSWVVRAEGDRGGDSSFPDAADYHCVLLGAFSKFSEICLRKLAEIASFCETRSSEKNEQTWLDLSFH